MPSVCRSGAEISTLLFVATIILQNSGFCHNKDVTRNTFAEWIKTPTVGQSALLGTLQQKSAVCTQEGNYDTDIPVMTGSC
jgi:hypothetical protein